MSSLSFAANYTDSVESHHLRILTCRFNQNHIHCFRSGCDCLKGKERVDKQRVDK